MKLCNQAYGLRKHFGLSHADMIKCFNVIGIFDICKFDSIIGCPDGTSLRMWIEHKYGLKAILFFEEAFL